MTYQGARARPEASEVRRVHAVSAVRLDTEQRVSHVRWTELNAGSNLDVSGEREATVADVLDALHAGAEVEAVFPGGRSGHLPRRFEAVEHGDGRESIVLAGPPSAGRELHDLTRLDG